MQATITISIIGSEYGVRLITCKTENLMAYPAMTIFPDNKERTQSLFPSEGVTITIKPQGHLVVAHQHIEKWILEGFSCEKVDLGSFSENWKGCSMILLKDE